MSTDSVKFTCQICGRQFDPDPRMICDGEWKAEVIPVDAEIPEDALTQEDLAEMDVDELRAAGIEPEDCDKMVGEGKSVETTFCICLECQDNAAEEQS